MQRSENCLPESVFPFHHLSLWDQTEAVRLDSPLCQPSGLPDLDVTFSDIPGLY